MRFDVVEKAFVPIAFEGLFIEVEEIGYACPACVGDDNV